MKIRLTFSLFALALLMISSCKKDDPVKTAKDYLTGRDCWKLVKFESKDSTGKYNDVTALLVGTDASDLDDCNKFTASGVYEQNEGASKCDPSDDQVISTGTWTLSADNKTLTLKADGASSVLNLETINGSEIIGSGTFTVGLVTSQVRMTFK